MEPFCTCNGVKLQVGEPTNCNEYMLWGHGQNIRALLLLLAMSKLYTFVVVELSQAFQRSQRSKESFGESSWQDDSKHSLGGLIGLQGIRVTFFKGVKDLQGTQYHMSAAYFRFLKVHSFHYYYLYIRCEQDQRILANKTTWVLALILIPLAQGMQRK